MTDTFPASVLTATEATLAENKAASVLAASAASVFAASVLTAKTLETKFHTDARDHRVLVATDRFAAAKLVRDGQEFKGLVESAGARLDRLAKEAYDLEEAKRLNVIEPFSIDVSNLAIQTLVTKTNEVIRYLNERDGSVGSVLGVPSVLGEAAVK